MIIAASAIVCLFFRPEFRDGKKKSEQVETLTLQYLNEDDRAYGLAGMALSAVALDASDLISSISLDSEDNMVLFSDGYYFIGSPSVSAQFPDYISNGCGQPVCAFIGAHEDCSAS